MNTTVCFTGVTNVATTATTAPATPLAVDIDGQPVRFFYDLPGFVSTDFSVAADAVDFWVGQHTINRRDEESAYAIDMDVEPTTLLADLRMYQRSWDLDLAANMTLAAALREILGRTVREVHGLAETDRGHFLAQLLTRFFSDGHIDWERFRLGHLLANYYSMMPVVGSALGAVSEGGEATVLGWDTPHGVYLDVVHVLRPPEEFVTADIATAFAIARDREWSSPVAGVRYLPLDHLDGARLYAPDGTWSAVVERAQPVGARPTHTD